MKFRTEYQAGSSLLRLDPEKGVCLLGSCFSDNIGGRMRRSLWNADVNPCGVLFNPMSISDMLNMAVVDTDIDFFPIEEYNGRWISTAFSYLNCATAEEARREGGERLKRLRENIRTCDAMLITWGTAFVFEDVRTEKIVANCHKLPAKRFRRFRVEIGDIVACWKETIAKVRKINPGMKFVFTVSPVRHLADGLAGNSLSKATLRLAAERLVAETENADYFPSFEILTDDLRDYRFYAEDMVHPSAIAEEYIYEKFLETYVDARGRAMLTEGAKLFARLQHRPLNPDTDEHRRFVADTRRLLADFRRRHPGSLAATL